MLDTSMNGTQTAPVIANTLPRVRSASPEDFNQIMQFCRALHHENGISNVDWALVAQKMMQGVNQDGAIIGVIGPVGKIEGMIYMQISSMWYSGEVILEELFNYVAPEYRRSSNAKALIEFGRSCAERFDVPLLIGIISNDRTEEKIRLYRRRLGPPAGAFFLVNAKTGK